ncbi:fructose-bisphosphatase class III [Eggerthella lenta]|uniref:fructose-bisphosphatase class III n=2 Tax=Eggerthella lenta TaxID=84112 RepID=UPI00038D41CF|nr:fructose-bisphosphatase class III [Eggerthella lenta]MCG4742134.1 fructose-bisphosphatase class III [Eggerthella lenta]MCG4777262.1 fructose-bisphosphatase class III [Eggerthella lenta]MDB1787241.1 fructose-bisphosphatase class III [Eggerthella lenta]RDC07661.1 fructose-bisphosphatase class III [Eggerthella lenta]BDF41453.1 fructose-1,6-bisphosphatase class 3 [Eggerthella lenta]
MDATDMRYLELLSRLFPSADKASAEIINLSAILNLPKGTEFFASDIHGEYEAFSHTLRNGSGSIRLKIDDVFGDSLSENEKRSLATLIYYPREKMELVLSQVDDAEAWYAVTLQRLVAVCKRAAQKYTRSRVRKALPKDFAYIIEELMTENRHGVDKQAYYAAIVDAVIRTDRGGALVEALCLLIQRLAIERLHIVGDIYDRGPYPHIIMDALMEHHSLDIQWGNHDIVWMGASLGQRGCIAHVVRNCARYGNLSILEDAYGINVLPLASFALEAYKDDPCVAFGLKGNPDLPPQELEMNVKIQKAMAVIQFKVEAQLIDENPGFGLEDRKLLDKIDYERGTVMLDGIEYELTDTVFPTVDPADPYRLTPEEEDVMQRLEQAFTGCEKLQRHMRFFLDAGSLYKICNGNLLFHACVPLNADGSLMETEVFGETYKGRALYDVMERYVRAAFDDADPELAKRGRDLLWYMWLGEGSPLFAKSKMATFELYLIAEKEARKEVKNPFYSYLDDERVMGGIFEDFGMDPETSRIVCGHVPVKVKDGEDPVKCGGRVLTIDGGFSKAYQPTTGIAGYTLISNSYGFVLAAHEPLESMRAAVVNELDIHSSRKVVELVDKRTLVADTDNGAVLKQQIADLEELLEAYRNGIVAEKE